MFKWTVDKRWYTICSIVWSSWLYLLTLIFLWRHSFSVFSWGSTPKSGKSRVFFCWFSFDNVQLTRNVRPFCRKESNEATVTWTKNAEFIVDIDVVGWLSNQLAVLVCSFAKITKIFFTWLIHLFNKLLASKTIGNEKFLDCLLEF